MKYCGKRAALIGVVLAIALGPCQAQERSTRIQWLSQNAVPIRSIDPTLANDDFADLKPLIKAIGDSRIVVLGEQSHGDGTTFLAKARLVKFLHQHMGFDVLAWEAGLFNCSEMDSAVRDGAVPLQGAIERGLYPIWGMSAQVRPVFEYARSVATTKRPLEMIGFDHQFSGMDKPGIRWRDAMIGFLDKADPALLPVPLRASLINDSHNIVFTSDAKPAALRSVAEKWKALPGILNASRAKLISVHGERQFALMRRSADDALISLEGLARFRESAGAFKPEDNNFRDQRMAENLIWLANERYKGRRIIVWAAVFHALHEPSAIKIDFFQSVLTMGQIARRSLDNAIYTIGFTAAEGKAGDVSGAHTTTMEAPAEGSFEDLCMSVGRPFLFVDFRGLPAAHWLREPISTRVSGNSPITTDWTRQLDATLFTRTMFPSSKGRMAPEGAALSDPPTSVP